MSDKIECVTSVSFPYFTKYGKRMASTFLEFVDEEIDLKIYHEASREPQALEDYAVPLSPRISTIDLHEECDISSFLHKAIIAIGKKAGRISMDPDIRLGDPHYDYNWDAVTFGKKAFSFVHAARTSQARFLFWVDADIVFRKILPVNVLRSLFGDGNPDIVHFAREHPHTETGFFGLDLSSPRIGKFVETYAAFWETGEVFKLQSGWTDSHVFDEARNRCPELKTRNLSTMPTGHVIAASPLGDYIDHQKGPRKQRGFSPEAR